MGLDADDGSDLASALANDLGDAWPSGAGLVLRLRTSEDGETPRASAAAVTLYATHSQWVSDFLFVVDILNFILFYSNIGGPDRLLHWQGNVTVR